MEPENPYAPPAAEIDATGTTPDTDLGNAETSRLVHLREEATVRAYGCLSLLVALFGSVWLVTFFTLIGFQSHWHSGLFVTAVAVGAPLFGVALVVVGVGFLGLRPWSRIAGVGVGVLFLPFLPVGTILGAFLLWVLTSTKGRIVLSPEHERIRERTPHVKPWPLAIVILFALLLFALLASALTLVLFAI